LPKEVELLWKDDGHHALVASRDRGPFRYRAFVPDPIADLELALPTDIAAAVEDAAQACAHLDASPGIGDLEPVARLLLRAESVASSRIEGLNLSHRRLEEAQFEPGGAKAAALSILRNIDAMQEAIRIGERADDLAVDDFLDIHRTLMHTPQDQAIAGVIRKQQNWIGGSNTPKRAEFVPPPPEYVCDLLEDLVAFSNRTDLSAVTQAAIAHAQFETIHPFADGNGRAGRCLIHVLFRRRGLSTRVVPPVSVVLAARTASYIGGLIAFRQGRSADWIGAFAEATATAGNKAIVLGSESKQLRTDWLRRLGRTRSGSVVRALVDGLAQQPIVSAQSVKERHGVSNEAARQAIDRLATAGILRQITLGKRNRAWAATEVFELLDEFDSDIRSRVR
jgi:Fic family protein